MIDKITDDFEKIVAVTKLKKLKTNLQKMKNTQSKIKPIKIGKQFETTYCFGCKNYMKDFRPKKVLREKMLFVGQINQDF